MINITLNFAAPRSYVWLCLTQKTGLWWSKDFYTSPATKTMILDDYLGGHLYEDFGNNKGVIWADVIAIKSGESVNLKGHLAPEFGGPNISFNAFDIEVTGDNSCKLHFSEHWIIAKDEKALASLEDGWRQILNGLKRFVENKKRSNT